MSSFYSCHSCDSWFKTWLAGMRRETSTKITPFSPPRRSSGFCGALRAGVGTKKQDLVVASCAPYHVDQDVLDLLDASVFTSVLIRFHRHDTSATMSAGREEPRITRIARMT